MQWFFWLVKNVAARSLFIVEVHVFPGCPCPYNTDKYAGFLVLSLVPLGITKTMSEEIDTLLRLTPSLEWTFLFRQFAITNYLNSSWWTWIKDCFFNAIKNTIQWFTKP